MNCKRVIIQATDSILQSIRRINCLFFNLKAINRANLNSISSAARVQKFCVIRKDFSLASGELGPTLKLKRPVIHKKYEELIERMYADSSFTKVAFSE
jgi:long-subunit acyl-CoA synthetase (AMP-forming)